MDGRLISGTVERTMRSCALLRSRVASAHARAPHARLLSTTSSKAQEVVQDRSVPRWQQTPPAMRMPFRVRPPPKQAVFKVNEDPQKLDNMYTKFLGRGGELLLPEEVRWLAVTHKSFDHGARGSNDRLAFLGKRIVDLQSSLALLRMPLPRGFDEEEKQQTPLTGLENLTPHTKQKTLDKRRLASLAREAGITEVMRWKPRKSDNLQSSGVETVAAHTLYAIIGAISLQKGGEATNALVRTRVLAPLGLRSSGL